MVDFSNSTNMRDVGFFDQTYKLCTRKGVPSCSVNYHSGVNSQLN